MDPETRVLVLSAYDDHDYVLATMEGGGAGVDRVGHLGELDEALSAR